MENNFLSVKRTCDCVSLRSLFRRTSDLSNLFFLWHQEAVAVNFVGLELKIIFQHPLNFWTANMCHCNKFSGASFKILFQHFSIVSNDIFSSYKPFWGVLWPLEHSYQPLFAFLLPCVHQNDWLNLLKPYFSMIRHPLYSNKRPIQKHTCC